jgi:hypothetical protein
MTPRFLTTLKMPLLAWAMYMFMRAWCCPAPFQQDHPGAGTGPVQKMSGSDSCPSYCSG